MRLDSCLSVSGNEVLLFCPKVALATTEVAMKERKNMNVEDPANSENHEYRIVNGLKLPPKRVIRRAKQNDGPKTAFGQDLKSGAGLGALSESKIRSIIDDNDLKPSSTLRIIGIVLGVAVLIGIVIYNCLPESREALEKRAGEIVTDILTEDKSFSSFFRIQEVANCILIKSGENSYTGSIDVFCQWKDASSKAEITRLFVCAVGSVNGAVLEGFKRQLVDPMEFKFDVKMLHDGSRYSVSCRVASKQPNPANAAILAILEIDR